MSKIGNFMQALMMSNPKIASWALANMPVSFWLKKGKQKALSVFYEASKRVPAYKDFLAKNNIDPKRIKNFNDFKKIPVIDKKSYIDRYSLEELVFDGDLTQMRTICTSSGSTGAPYFWPRLPEQDRILPKVMRLLYTQFFDIDKKSTLLFITLALGTWAAGELAAESSRAVADRKDIPLTVITPGLNIEETVEIVKRLKNKYEQIVFVGYPPFIKDIIEKGEEEGIDWKKLDIKMLLGGEGFSEKWRDFMLQRIGAKDDLRAIMSLFAAADSGVIGFETPLSILIKRLAIKDNNLNKDLFKHSESPYLFQFNPLAQFLEEEKGEILLTVRSGIPLIRYNIHDRGGLITFDKALKILSSHGYNPLKMLTDRGYIKTNVWRWPFLYVFGRSNAVNWGGALIYFEQIKTALENEMLFRTNTGKFKVSIVEDQKHNTFLKLDIELAKGILPTDDLKNQYKEIILRTLLELNKEYKSSYLKSPKEKAQPIIELHKFGEEMFELKRAPKYRYK